MKVERRGFTDVEAVKVFKTADSEDDAETPDAIAARIVGHSTHMGITYGTYSREDLPVVRDALLKVKLPKPATQILKSASW
ncbi:hypothetical protein G5V57_16695 [Nordella sp. HKS 07]|uniref:hypothetical protein n=1 Tax=Nordella sp. HKS 07 TaxID=2712222 RepID=UPI0013E19F1E|nr:hypothetical protein [Nordella sp. HKS 07]QIG49211.1 hypothetical protein G5V57_16695 [Nordella sp. HKS 07]